MTHQLRPPGAEVAASAPKPFPVARLRPSLSAGLVDLSLGGFSAELTVPLPPDRRLVVDLGDAEESFPLSARVVWSWLVGTVRTPGGDTVPLYRLGARFEDPQLERSREVLHRFELHTAVRDGSEARAHRRNEAPARPSVTLSWAVAGRLVELDATQAVLEIEESVPDKARLELEVELEAGHRGFAVQLASRPEEHRGSRTPQRLVLRLAALTPLDRQALDPWLTATPPAPDLLSPPATPDDPPPGPGPATCR